MRRVSAWSIPLALIAFGLLWPLVFRGGSKASPADDPVVFSNYRAEFVVNGDGQLDAVETITARISRQTARHLPVLGRRKPEQSPRAAETRGDLGPARRSTRARTKCCGRTANGSGSPRSETRTDT